MRMLSAVGCGSWAVARAPFERQFGQPPGGGGRGRLVGGVGAYLKSDKTRHLRVQCRDGQWLSAIDSTKRVKLCPWTEWLIHFHAII